MLVDPSRIPAIAIFEAPTFPDGARVPAPVVGSSRSSRRAAFPTTSRRPFRRARAAASCAACTSVGPADGQARALHRGRDSGRRGSTSASARRRSATTSPVELRGRNYKIIWVPPGFAHGHLRARGGHDRPLRVHGRARSGPRRRHPLERPGARDRVAHDPDHRLREGPGRADAGGMARRSARAHFRYA